MRNLIYPFSFVSSFIGLSMIYIAALNSRSIEMPLSDISSDLIGKTVTTSGYLIYKRTHPEGHVFLTISDDEITIQVPLFSGFMKSLDGLTDDDFKIGEQITVTGLLDEYKGDLQVIPRKPSDLQLG